MDFDFDNADDNAPKPKRGRLFSQTSMRQILGIAAPTFANLIREGCPVASQGVRGNRQWEMNSADVVDWYVARAVAKATGTGATATSLDAAKVRDKEAQARMRELQVAAREGEIIPIGDALRFHGKVAGEVRARALALESQVHGLTDDQREQLQEAVHDMLSGLAAMQLEMDVTNVDVEDEDSESGLEGAAQ